MKNVFNGIETMQTITIVVPCYNEEKNIRPMYIALTDVLKPYSNYEYEIVFRDNGSTDGSLDELRRIASDKHVKVISNVRNYGLGGYKDTVAGRVCGDVIISIACDFQDPPELIPTFIQFWEEGYEAVCGCKTSSKEGVLKYHARQLFYNIIGKMSDIPQYKNVSGITLMSRRLYDMSCNNPEMSFRYFLADLGIQVKLVEYEQQARRSGKSSYNIWRYLSFAIDSMVTTSYVPLRIATTLGFFTSIVSFCIGVVYLILKLVLWYKYPVGMAPVLIGMFFLGSVQLFFVGILGEYVRSILDRVSIHNPPVVKELINYDKAIVESDSLLFPIIEESVVDSDNQSRVQVGK